MQATSSDIERPRIAERFSQLVASLAFQTDRFAPYLAIAAVIAMFGVAIMKALYRGFWYDELFSVFIAKSPRFDDIWSIAKTGVDPQPPFYHYLIRASIHLFGNDALGVRAPSIVGFGLFCLSLFWFVARRTSKLYGLIALLFPATTGLWYYATEGRPYALVLACTGVAAVCWQSIAFDRRRKAALAGLALSLAIAMGVHYYSVLLLATFGFAEAIRTLERRKFDSAVWVAVSAPILIWIPLIPVMRDGLASAGAPGLAFAVPRWYISLVDFGNHFLGTMNDQAVGDPRGCILALIAAACICFAFQIFESGAVAQSDERYAANWRQWTPEAALIIALVCVFPFGVILVSKLVTHVLFARYLIDSAFGIVILIPFIMWMALHGRREPALIVSLVFACVFAITAMFDLSQAREGRSYAAVESVRKHIPALARNDQLPIAVPAVTEFLELSYYLDPALSKRIWYVADEESPMRIHGGEHSILASAPYFGTQVIDYKEFAREHPVFYVVARPMLPGWLISRWNKQGAEVQVLQGGIMDTTWASSDVFLRVTLHGAGNSVNEPYRGE